MAFKRPRARQPVPKKPEDLFRDLRAKTIDSPYAHQADIWRAFEKEGVDKLDVAIELPTGSGKTLVGLVLAEWTRRRQQGPVVYLCPTNQLVNQVTDQARRQYGLDVDCFTGRVANYAQAAKTRYLQASTVAITSYSALFNTNPFFIGADLIVLDDAHASQNYIASLWTVRIERFNGSHAILYQALASLFRPILSTQNYEKMVGDDGGRWDAPWVDKLPTPYLKPLIPDLISIIDSHADNLDIRYSWQQIRDFVQACHVYVSFTEILIRPLIPPTNTHSAFSDPRQRIYMSATLGEGGELERLTGRSDITRIAVPDVWRKTGVGRRFFFFPTASLGEEEVQELNTSLMQEAGRSLLLVPNNRAAAEAEEYIGETIGYPTVTASEIEDSKEDFVDQEQAVAVIANRYDGIDFPGDQCRLLIIEGLPRATNLQEKFLIDRLGASALIDDRILTRISQATGRCTRSDTDYALVVICGDELSNYLMRADKRKHLHPELQAELEFGLDNSKDVSIKRFLSNAQLFWGRSKDWFEVEGDIVTIREDKTKHDLPGKDELRKSVEHELKYQYCLWREDYEGALNETREILAILNDPALQSYRTLWCYLAGCTAWYAAQDGAEQLGAVARDYFRQAQRSTVAVPWFRKLARQTGERTAANEGDKRRLMSIRQVERLESVFVELGMAHNRKYSKSEKDILDGVNSHDGIEFEKGHVMLGRLLGFECDNSDATGAPDPWWIADQGNCIVFEDYAGAGKNAVNGITKARQLDSHPTWIRENVPLNDDARIVPVFITPVIATESSAFNILKDHYVWIKSDFVDWAVRNLSVIRELRISFPGTGDLVWRAEAAERLEENAIDLDGILGYARWPKPRRQLQRTCDVISMPRIFSHCFICAGYPIKFGG